MAITWRGAGSALALVLASLLLTGAIAEVGLRLAGYSALHDVYSTPELFWRRDGLLGWSLEPNARGRYTGPRPYPIEYQTTIETNSHGLRGPEIGPREPGELRILVLGDSYVAGFEVEQPETFAALIEAPLRQRLGTSVRVINAGVRGYGTDQMLLWFRERGRAFGADLVVLVVTENDFEDNLTLHRPRRPFAKPAFSLRPDGALELVGTPVPDYEVCSSWVLDEAYRPARTDGAFSHGMCLLQVWLADRSALFSVVATSLVRLPGAIGFLNRLVLPSPETPARQASLWALPLWPRTAAASDLGARRARSRIEQENELTTALLQAFAREVKASGASFLLILWPSLQERVDMRALRADQIDVQNVLARGYELGELQFRNDSHLNALGHRVYAEGLLPIVEEALRARREPTPRQTPARRPVFPFDM